MREISLYSWILNECRKGSCKQLAVGYGTRMGENFSNIQLLVYLRMKIAIEIPSMAIY